MRIEDFTDQEEVVDFAIFNYFGFVGYFAFGLEPRFRQFFAREPQVNLWNIQDHHLDATKSIKLLYDFRVGDNFNITQMLRLLNEIKSRRISPDTFDPDQLKHFMIRLRLEFNRPSARMFRFCNQYMNDYIDIGVLLFELYRLSRLSRYRELGGDFNEISKFYRTTLIQAYKKTANHNYFVNRNHSEFLLTMFGSDSEVES